jgi:hypothetical protein
VKYKNDRNFGILLADVGKMIKPFETVDFTEEQLKMLSVKQLIESRVLVELTSIGDVVLPPGVVATPEEFGTILVDGISKMPGTAQVKSLEEVLQTNTQAGQKELDAVGEDLKKK